MRHYHKYRGQLITSGSSNGIHHDENICMFLITDHYHIIVDQSTYIPNSINQHLPTISYTSIYTNFLSLSISLLKLKMVQRIVRSITFETLCTWTTRLTTRRRTHDIRISLHKISFLITRITRNSHCVFTRTQRNEVDIIFVKVNREDVQ